MLSWILIVLCGWGLLTAQTIEGLITYQSESSPLVDVNIQIYTLDSDELIYETYTDKEGAWKFQLSEDSSSVTPLEEYPGHLMLQATELSAEDFSIYNARGQNLRDQLQITRLSPSQYQVSGLPDRYYINFHSGYTPELTPQAQDSVRVLYRYGGLKISEDTLELHDQVLNKQWTRFSVRSRYFNLQMVPISGIYLRVFLEDTIVDYPMVINSSAQEYSGDFFFDESYQGEVVAARVYARDTNNRVNSTATTYLFDLNFIDLKALPDLVINNALPWLNFSYSIYSSPATFLQDLEWINLGDLGTDPVIRQIKLNGQEYSLLGSTSQLDSLIPNFEDSLTLNWELYFRDADSNETSVQATSILQKSFMDNRDSNVYRITNIGNRKWMAENLRLERNTSSCYDDDLVNCDNYGRLYSPYQLDTLCPQGWGIPTREDWEGLFDIILAETPSASKVATQWLGMGNELLQGPDPWSQPQWGFSALYAGFRWSDDNFYEARSSTQFWIDQPGNINETLGVHIFNNTVNIVNRPNSWQLSVRCIQEP